MSKNIAIRLADMTYIDSCVEILQDSVLGKAYFSDHKKATDMLSYAVAQNNVYVALDEHGKCLGFIYYMTKGVFGSYPYLHIIAVKEEYRSHGMQGNYMKTWDINVLENFLTFINRGSIAI